jgi:hypothetical protein
MNGHAMMSAGGGSLDEAYEQFAHAAAELPNGFVNHGPMACEALSVLGYEDRVPEWARRYTSTMVQVAATHDRLDPAHWRDALGHIELLHSWTSFFTGALTDDGWRSVVRLWVPRLLPAMGSVLFHGMIRTAHAVRAVSTTATEPRVAELGRALAYWAARYGRSRLALPVVPPPPMTDDLGVNGPAKAVLVEAELAARQYLTHPTIAVLHGVTGAMALALLLPHIDKAAATGAVEQLRRVERALAPTEPAVVAATSAPDFERFAALAVGSGDAHQVKLVEACGRAHLLTHNGAFAAAAAQVTSG